jgi:hypothetical protein
MGGHDHASHDKGSNHYDDHGHHNKGTYVPRDFGLTETDRRLWGYYSPENRDLCSDSRIAYFRCMRDLTDGMNLLRKGARLYFVGTVYCSEESNELNTCELEKYRRYLKRNSAEIESLRS